MCPNFFSRLEQECQKKSSKELEDERKTDYLAMDFARLTALRKRPFLLTAELVAFIIGATRITTSKSDLLVVKLNESLVLRIMEDRHTDDYRGKKGCWQIAGEMIGYCLYNLANESKKQKASVEVVAQDKEMYGIRFIRDELAFFHLKLTKEQLLDLRCGIVPEEEVVIHAYPPRQQHQHGLSLLEPATRKEAFENTLKIVKRLKYKRE